MTRGEALKDFFRKTILPVASAALLYCIFRSACVKTGALDYLWLWILCGLPFGISARIDAAMQLLSNDPMVFARCMLGHTGWLGRHLLRSVRVSGLDIFWTVTADEASATAELFGAEMALANNLLALVQQYIRVQSDRLWLEPDFTGERAGERIVSFRLTSCAAVLRWLVIRLLHRLWKDPQLQPAAKA